MIGLYLRTSQNVSLQVQMLEAMFMIALTEQCSFKTHSRLMILIELMCQVICLTSCHWGSSLRVATIIHTWSLVSHKFFYLHVIMLQTRLYSSTSGRLIWDQLGGMILYCLKFLACKSLLLKISSPKRHMICIISLCLKLKKKRLQYLVTKIEECTTIKLMWWDMIILLLNKEILCDSKTLLTHKSWER